LNFETLHAITPNVKMGMLILNVSKPAMFNLGV